jgi:hypothetical protein
MNKNQYKFIVLVLCILNTGLAFPEDVMIPFDEKIGLNFSGKYNMGIFRQQSTSINTIMGCNISVFLWDKDNFDTLAPATMSVTFSKRF